MRIEHISQGLGFIPGHLNGVAAAVIVDPPVGLESVLVRDFMSLGILTHLTAGETAHL